MENTQVYDVRSGKAISVSESNEQQRNWDDQMWDRKAHENGANYDRTRAHLNFEITKGAVVQPIDTSRSITQKMWESLNSRGIDPYKKRYSKNRIFLAKMIFQGSRTMMHKIAFGDQLVDLTRGADNSHIKRSKDIEDWAKDIYNYVSKKYGEENIVGFYVHLDEVCPHIHCSVLPVTPDNELQYNYWFSGGNREESSRLFREEHDRIAAINAKWGLKRGQSIKETGAKHRSTEEYRREAAHLESEVESLKGRKRESLSELDALYQEMNTLKRKIRSFTTMVVNLERQREDIEGQIADIKKILGASPDMPNEELAAKMNELNMVLASVVEKLESKQAALEQAQKDLDSVRAEKDIMLALKNQLQKQNTETLDNIEKRDRYNLNRESNALISGAFSRILPTLSASQRQSIFTTTDGIFDASLLQVIASRTVEVVNCAALLYQGFIESATTYAESCGGGGGPGGGWRKKDDEDDLMWKRRCLGQAAKMVGSRGVKRKR